MGANREQNRTSHTPRIDSPQDMPSNTHSHLVFGAGLIGGFLGGALHNKSVNTVLVGRGKALNRLRQPLTLSSVDGDKYTVENLVTYSSDEAATANENHNTFDVVWLTTKAVGMEETLDSLTPLISGDTIIICCQNGLGSADIVKNRFPDNTVLKSLVVFNVTALDNNRLHRATQGEILIEQHPSLDDSFFKQVNSSLTTVKAHENIEGVIWAKLQMNLINAINAAANLPVKVMMRDRRYRLFYANMLNELPRVARAKGVRLEQLVNVPMWMIPIILRLPDFLYKLIENSVIKMDETTKASMWWDINEQRATEIDFLQGALIAEARQLGIECPYNTKVLNVIKALEQGSLPWDDAGETLLRN